MDYAEELIYLAGCAVNGIAPDRSRIDGLDVDRLYDIADYHMMTAVTAMAMELSGVKHEVFTQAKAKALRKAVILEADCKAISERLERSGIWHMPLKGSVLGKYYPVFGMRQMSDVDILFEASRSEDVREIMIELGFTCEMLGNNHHDVYHRLPVSNVEMHRELFSEWPYPVMSEYYSNVKERLIPDDGKKYTYHFSHEDFYVYMTAHAYKHYSGGGTGLRSVLDTYVYLKKFADVLDWEYIFQEAGKLGISDFEGNMRSLADNLFGGHELTRDNRAMLDYIISSGTYGTIGTAARNEMIHQYGGSRAKYILSKIFPPMDKVRYVYPFFYRHKYLYPVLVIYRLLKALTVSRYEVMAELKGVK